jgi:hypothetical protein
MAAILLGLVTSCTATSSGTPTTAPNRSTPATTTSVPTTSKQPSGDLPTDGAPKVKTPVELGRFGTEPCLALTDAQRNDLGVSAGEPREGALGQDCDWRSNQGGRLTVSILDGNPRGLSSTYAAKAQFKLFEPLPDVEGQPIAIADATNRRAQGECRVVVGLSDQLTFSVTLTQSADKVGTVDPCEVAARVAGIALKTIKAG